MKLNSTHNRAGWSSNPFVGHVAAGALLQRMHARGDDRPLDQATATKFDREEWE